MVVFTMVVPINSIVTCKGKYESWWVAIWELFQKKPQNIVQMHIIKAQGRQDFK